MSLKTNTTTPRIAKGKNIRVSEESWNKIRKYCFTKGFKVGKFTEDAALEIIKQSKIKK